MWALRDATCHGRVLTEVVERGVRLELAAALRITEHAAGDLLGFAEALVHSYPAVLTSMERARVTERHAEILVGALNELEPEFRGQVIEPGLALAEAEPVGTFRRKLRTLIDTVRSATLTERYERAVTKRRIAAEPDDDGMGWLHLYAPMVAITAAQARATAMAKAITAADGDTRTLDQARADVVLDLLIDGSVEAQPEQARGVRATVFVTVPVLALLHETDASRAAAASTRRSSRASGRSRCPWPEGSPAAHPGGRGCSPIPRREWSSPSAAISTGRHRRWRSW
ncbi:DUF222 domain-containing protein [Microbacterium sp. NPDC056569]|uniref:DUF222 domain-containing protein n=1 Tax=Microbacterium sp. NPDC056569 TaxID=3345867 RepID=UPI00366B16FA